MAADINEGAEFAGGVAHDEDRHRREILGEVVAGVGNLRAEAGDDRMMAEEDVALAGGASRRSVGGGVVVRESIGHRRRAAIDGVEYLVDESDLGCVLHCGNRDAAIVSKATRYTIGCG